MSYRIEKETGDLVIEGFEKGVSPSPHTGIANIQNANISTEMNEVLASFGRTRQSQAVVSGATLTASPGAGNFYLASNVPLQVGTWITIGSSSITSLSAGTYYVSYKSNGLVQLSANYDPTAANVISHGTSGTATYNTFRDMGAAVAKATEKFTNSNGVQYRYYILDANGLIWVYDTAVYTNSLFVSGTATTWFLPDAANNYYSGTAPSGIAVLNGWLMSFAGNTIWVKSTMNLGGTTSNTSTWVAMTNAIMMSLPTTTNPHFAFVGHQGRLYYTDGAYIGSIFPNTSLLTSQANVQSFASYTASTTTGTISALLSGTIPWTSSDAVGTTVRIPAVFYTDQAGVQPTNLSVNVVYYIAYSPANSNFQVFAAASGGSAINIASGASGNQYFNTFFPIGTHAGAYGDTSTVTFTPQRLNLPTFEVSQCMAEVGNTVIIGGLGDVLYPWNQVDALPSSIISLPEKRTYNLITVNQMVYAFVGNKGNVYITDGSVASTVIKVPDYCAGIAGTPSSYIEPYFTWGGAAYSRGRVYFSILDQTSSKAGNCGGIWSFVPTQALYIGQDIGLALRLENLNSYGTLNGVAPVILIPEAQNALGPQYWAAWYSSITSPAYGIDFTDTIPVSSFTVETDLIPTGTMLNNQTDAQIEYKLTTGQDTILSGGAVTMSYRQNSTDAYVSCGTNNVFGNTSLSGYFTANFQSGQWLQFLITVTPVTTSASTFMRLSQIRVRQ